MRSNVGNQVLAGIRVIDLGHALAGPFAATMLGDFGAEVIKVEVPGLGDPMRRLGPRKEGVGLWWKAAGRNKKSVTIDFRQPAGRKVLLSLVRRSDVVIENFRPGTLEKYQLGWDGLSKENPRLIMLRISGFGQRGVASRRPGFGRIAEAMSGSAQLTGDPNGPPGHVGYSLADTLAGLMGAYGILLALIGRARDGAGECIDLALYEPLFRLIDWQVIVYDQLGMAPVRAGNGFPEALEGVAAGVAKTSDGVWMSYSAATDSVLSRLIEMIYSKPLDSMDEFASAELRRRQCRDIEERLDAWIEARTAAEVEATFAEHDAVVGRVYDMADIWTDPTYRERDNIISVADPDYGAVSMHGVVPKLVTRPGVVQSVGEPLGAHTSQVLRELADLDDDAIADLMKQGVI